MYLLLAWDYTVFGKVPYGTVPYYGTVYSTVPYVSTTHMYVRCPVQCCTVVRYRTGTVLCSLLALAV